MDPRQLEVPLEKLRWRCDPNSLKFKRTDELEPLQEFIGQDRAMRAISFGLAIDHPGYNIFLTGLSGTGKASIIRSHLESLVREQRSSGRLRTPDDWCYLYNFSDPDHPNLAKLPAGTGKQLKQRLERLQEEVRREIAQGFEGDDYERRRKGITQEAQSASQEIFRQLDQDARAQGFMVQFTPTGVGIAPLLGDRPATPEEFAQWDIGVHQELERKRLHLMEQVEKAAELARNIDQGAAAKIGDLHEQMAAAAVTRPFSEVIKAYASNPQLEEFLVKLKQFTIEHVGSFEAGAGHLDVSPMEATATAEGRREAELPFSVNCFVDNSAADGPPIIEESNPTFSNLFGRIERRFSLGAYVTDHTMLRAGAVQVANGGFLILDMRHIVGQSLVWETLKRMVKTKQVRPEDAADAMGAMTPQAIKAELMPLDVKLVVTGDSAMHNYLAAYDEDFWETFKVKADFDYQIRRTDEHLHAYACFIGGATQKHGLFPFDAGAAAKVIEYSARAMADQEKLSTRFGMVTDLLIEADHWARSDPVAVRVVEARHVQKAIEEKVYRANLVEERVRDVIRDGTIMVDVDGDVIGQVNGLVVLNAGDFSFGRPSRITVRTYLGRGGVINIEREAQLSGKSHDKGVLIIGGYLGWRYAQEEPLSVTASIAFEQSYGGIDGDSASSTEIYAILSSLSGAPLKQGLAVTGSVNQKGEVQAIGGVNEKIEGFFDVCKALGFSGRQGVLIPKQNVRNLMLREDIVEAVQEGLFRVYAIGSIDEGIELLTGTPAGTKDAEGKYPDGTINHMVDRQLRAYTESQRSATRRNGEPAENVKSGDVAPAEPEKPIPEVLGA